MKKTLLFFIFSISALLLSAQTISTEELGFTGKTALSPLESDVEFEKDTIIVDTLVTGEEFVIDIFLTNKGNETKNLYWQVEVVDFSSDWQFLICDSQNCYPPNRTKSSKNSPNVLEPDSTQFWTFHYNDNSVADTGLLILRMYDDKEFSNVVDSVFLIFKTRFNTATSDLDKDRLYISPNPTSDHFNISDLSEVSQVEIYNIIGRRIKTYSDISSGYFDVSDIRDGMYLVRILDKSNRVLKVTRLNVTKSRP